MPTRSLCCVMLLPEGGFSEPVAKLLQLAHAEIVTGKADVVAWWPGGGKSELEAVRAAREAASHFQDSGIRATGGIHASGPDPEGVARALAGVAATGAVVVSKAVERLLPRRFRFVELPALMVGAETVLPYEVGEEIGNPGEFGPRPALVGRKSEIQRLEQAVLASSRILVAGEPGSGRAALLRAVRDRSPGAFIACCRCDRNPPSPFGALGDIVRSQACASGFDRGDGERVVEAVKRLGGSADDADAIALSLGLKLGVEVEPSGGGAEAAWTRLLSQASLLCLENLEDAGADVLAVLDSLPATVCILATGTPGTALPRGFERLDLPPLPTKAARELATRLGLFAELPFPLPTVPMRLEEMAADLTPSGDSALGGRGDSASLEMLARSAHDPKVRSVMETLGLGNLMSADFPVFGSIATRFSRVRRDIQETLGAAAILGRSFWRFAVERLLGEDAAAQLTAARGAGWIVEREGALMGVDGELLFRHPLYRRAALASLAAEERRRLHEAAAAMYAQRARLVGPALEARAAWHRAEAAKP